MARSKGSHKIAIGVIDGPVDLNHKAFIDCKITTAKPSQLFSCKRADNMACMHGTFVTGILTGARGTLAPALCPNCEIVLRPIFSESSNVQDQPSSTPEELAQAIFECVNAGVKIINLSVGLSTTSLIKFRQVEDAYIYALKRGVIIIAAAGNQGQLGYFSILDNPWIIPVVACDDEGRPHPLSNISPSIAKHGVMAPGINITSAQAGGGFKKMSGTSFASAFVSGTVALLWSIFKNATAQEIVLILRKVGGKRNRCIFPPLFNAEKSSNMLESLYSSRIGSDIAN